MRNLHLSETEKVTGAAYPIDGFLCFEMNNDIWCGTVRKDYITNSYIDNDNLQKMNVKWKDGHWYFYSNDKL